MPYHIRYFSAISPHLRHYAISADVIAVHAAIACYIYVYVAFRHFHYASSSFFTYAIIIGYYLLSFRLLIGYFLITYLAITTTSLRLPGYACYAGLRLSLLRFFAMPLRHVIAIYCHFAAIFMPVSAFITLSHWRRHTLITSAVTLAL